MFGAQPWQGALSFNSQTPSQFNIPQMNGIQQPYANNMQNMNFQNQMQPMQQGFQQPIQQQVQPQQISYECIQVNSADEARGAAIAMNGTPTIMKDMSGGAIYEKKFDLSTGGFVFDVYEKKLPEVNVVKEEVAPLNLKDMDIVSKSDLENFKSEMFTALSQQNQYFIDNVKEFFGGNINEYDANDGDVAIKPTTTNTTNGKRKSTVSTNSQ